MTENTSPVTDGLIVTPAPVPGTGVLMHRNYGGGAITVHPDHVTIWEQNGWRRSDTTYGVPITAIANYPARANG